MDSPLGAPPVNGQPRDECGFCAGFLLWSHSLVSLTYDEQLLREEDGREERELAQGP